MMMRSEEKRFIIIDGENILYSVHDYEKHVDELVPSDVGEYTYKKKRGQEKLEWLKYWGDEERPIGIEEHLKEVESRNWKMQEVEIEMNLKSVK